MAAFWGKRSCGDVEVRVVGLKDGLHVWRRSLASIGRVEHSELGEGVLGDLKGLEPGGERGGMGGG